MSAVRSVIASLICLVGGAAAPTNAPATPPQGAALLKADILGVFAHPDDETGAAATLAHYALAEGAVVVNVYCTRGEGGGNMVGTQSGPALGILREAELRQCLAQLGVRACYFLDREDFAYTESLAITVEKWGREETLRRLVRLVRALRPEIILTMNPAPHPGQHGNHQAAGLFAIEAFDAAADPQQFPEQLRQEGLTVWRPRKLYFGGPADTGMTLDVNRALPDGRSLAAVAGEALSHHRSQGFGGIANSPWLRRPQNWTLALSVVPFEQRETDLRRGLPVAGDTPQRLLAVGDEASLPDFALRFTPRPAVDFYEQWVAQRRIGHVATPFAADLPVVAGETNEVRLVARNRSARTVETGLRLAAAEGWQIITPPTELSVPAESERVVSVRVVPPVGRPADAELLAETTIDGTDVRAAARLHPVPRLEVPRAPRPLELSASDDHGEWRQLRAHPIHPSDTWQGTVTNAADCSGEFRMAHDTHTLWVEVRVRDDRVVSNIAPNDIKGHWRSDSVELCFDPSGGAEHTLGCFKVGIFPFDSAGRVRAARDADARPGPIEDSAPGMRLVSWKTPDGYAIRAALPLAELGIAASSRPFGMNVLIYDGDKVDAASGENINRARLAWAPRLGVQGRPEDWGRAVLK